MSVINKLRLPTTSALPVRYVRSVHIIQHRAARLVQVAVRVRIQTIRVLQTTMFAYRVLPVHGLPTVQAHVRIVRTVNGLRAASRTVVQRLAMPDMLVKTVRELNALPVHGRQRVQALVRLVQKVSTQQQQAASRKACARVVR